MLLRFRVANHRSIREEQELSLVAVPKRGEAKPKAHEIPPTVHVAGIYGANASGKSNVLDALRWMSAAVKYSHIHWQPDAGVPREPFRLDDTSHEEPSFYEIDFVFEGVRHSYGFEVTDREVVGEWLFVFPHGRPKRLFEREGPQDYKFGKSLKGELRRIEKLTRPNSLYLSCAASNNHPYLSSIHHWIGTHIRFATQNSFDEGVRFRFTQSLIEDPGSKGAEYVSRLVRVADLGITDIVLSKREIDGFEKEFISFIRERLPDIPEEEFRKRIEQRPLFIHDYRENLDRFLSTRRAMGRVRGLVSWDLCCACLRKGTSSSSTRSTPACTRSSRPLSSGCSKIRSSTPRVHKWCLPHMTPLFSVPCWKTNFSNGTKYGSPRRMPTGRPPSTPSSNSIRGATRIRNGATFKADTALCPT